MKTTKAYRLSNSILEGLDLVAPNRSQGATAAFKMAHLDPEMIIKELRHRLSQGNLQDKGESTRISVYMPVFVAANFDELVAKLQLPNEDVARLALEGYIRAMNSHKDSNEPPRPLQPLPEG